MVHRTYVGLGPPERAIRHFEMLSPYARELLEMKRACPPFGADDAAMGIAVDGLETAAYHFTRRRDFYAGLKSELFEPRRGNNRLSDPAEALAAFKALTPYVDGLRALMDLCRPFGRDYLALMIARDSLETAAFHFTRQAHFYSAKGDSAGPRPP